MCRIVFACVVDWVKVVRKFWKLKQILWLHLKYLFDICIGSGTRNLITFKMNENLFLKTCGISHLKLNTNFINFFLSTMYLLGEKCVI